MIGDRRRGMTVVRRGSPALDICMRPEWRLIRWPVILHCARRELQPERTGCSNDKGADSIVRNPRLRAPHYK